MKRLFLDLETSFFVENKKKNPSPYIPSNYVISIGLITENYPEDKEYYFFYDDPATKEKVQILLDQADEIVAYNSKFDISWLLETGHDLLPIGGTRVHKLYDPMVVEYVLARGLKLPMGLDDAAVRRGLSRKKSELVQKYFDENIQLSEAPKEVVAEYGIQDCRVLRELYHAQQAVLAKPENTCLAATIELSFDFIPCLIEMERNGINIDLDQLDKVETEYTQEYKQLRDDLERLAATAMGATKINLDSPEQLSWLIYSRRVNNKNLWSDLFNLGMELRGSVMKPKRRPRMSSQEFVDNVRRYTSVIYRTRAEHCVACQSTGMVHKTTVAGKPFKKPTKCKACGSSGYVLHDLPQVAGFKCAPIGPEDASAGGFATDKETIERLAQRAMGDAKEFLSKISRYNAVGTYIDTFCKGIRRGRGADGILHTQLMQCITATGRLSSQAPNFQNMPRFNTFPIRGVVTSRFKGGHILEVDAAKLEYAAAVFLAQDRVGMADILADVDAHKLTSQILSVAGQETNRQDAKSHTFKPLYGGSSGTKAEQEYYEWFKDKHKGITAWQDKNKETVLAKGVLRLPSGREYRFLNTKRLFNGYITNSTSICNYPVQGFATADIIPALIIEVRRLINERPTFNSLLILTVHDSIVFDVYPGEEGLVSEVINRAFANLGYILYTRYGITLNVPFGWETKLGPNWLKMKECYKSNGQDSLTAFTAWLHSRKGT